MGTKRLGEAHGWATLRVSSLLHSWCQVGGALTAHAQVVGLYQQLAQGCCFRASKQLGSLNPGANLLSLAAVEAQSSHGQHSSWSSSSGHCGHCSVHLSAARALAVTCMYVRRYVIKTMTQLEVKGLFNKYNFHKSFLKQLLLPELYNKHWRAVRESKKKKKEHEAATVSEVPKIFVLIIASFQLSMPLICLKLRINIVKSVPSNVPHKAIIQIFFLKKNLSHSPNRTGV